MITIGLFLVSYVISMSVTDLDVILGFVSTRKHSPTQRDV